MATKAPADGHYHTTDEQGRVHRFKVQKGDVYPEDAEFVAAETKPADAKPAKAKTDAKGPSATTASAGPSETS